MSMNFLDETDDWAEYQIIRDEIRRLENEHLELQKALSMAESASHTAPADDDLRVEVNRLRAILKDIEKKLDESISMYR
jgi:hypothetical protein